jgi:RNA polymerase sigma factor (TIGR02999 family)
MTSGGQPGEVTQLLTRWRTGDPKALDELMPLVYGELRELAGRALQRERPHHTLQSTALVNEAYLRLIDYTRIDWRGRAHFLGVAATIIRQILVDHSRGRLRSKRGGGNVFLQLEENLAGGVTEEVNMVALDDALSDLARLDAQQAKVVELRFFGGLSIEETAEVLAISDSTVKRDWAVARSWLFRELQPGGLRTASPGT